jgi:uncharacterized protein YjbI with pentapeptide repeats
MNDYESIEYGRVDNPKFKGNEFIDCTFNEVELSESDLTSSKIIESEFKNCNLSNSIVTNSTLRDVSFIDCKMIGVNWSNSHTLSHVRFVNCILDYSIFQNLKILGAHFESCSLREADFSQSKLVSASFSGSSLSSCNFNGCNLEKADFRLAKDFFIDPAYTNIKKAIFSMPEAVNLLKAFDIIIKD